MAENSYSDGYEMEVDLDYAAGTLEIDSGEARGDDIDMYEENDIDQMVL
jgi:hypothetical protein